MTKHHILGDINNRSFSQFWRLGDSRSRCQQMQFLVFFPGLRKAAFSVHPHITQDVLVSFRLLTRHKSDRGETTLMTSSKLNYLPKAPLRPSTYEFLEDTNFQYIILYKHSKSMCINYTLLKKNTKSIWINTFILNDWTNHQEGSGNTSRPRCCGVLRCYLK